jgi:hypothetical protein
MEVKMKGSKSLPYLATKGLEASEKKGRGLKDNKKTFWFNSKVHPRSHKRYNSQDTKQVHLWVKQQGKSSNQSTVDGEEQQSVLNLCEWDLRGAGRLE